MAVTIGAGRPDPDFWRGKRVLLTGHTGFKGAWLAFWLDHMGATVTSFALPPSTTPSLCDLLRLRELCDTRTADVRDPDAVRRIVKQTRPEITLHLAAQALVRAGYREPVETFATNVMGTVHVLDALRDGFGKRVVVVATSDKVYRNREWPWPYREADSLGGRDPYSASKAASELAIECWRSAFLSAQGVAVASVRAGNVIGGGDWSQERLVPDAVRAWHSGEALEVRRPQATRPWQHVVDLLAGYLMLAERLWAEPAVAGAYNFGPPSHEAATVRDVVEAARRHMPEVRVHYGDGSEGPHEAGSLALETSKASQTLGWWPRFTLAEAIERTIDWYRRQATGSDARDLCLEDISMWMVRQ